MIRRKETVVNRTFTRLIEALGYDILITYVKRDPAALNNVEQKGVTF